ncbi:MAG: YgiQ family radical SAM protein [Clostridia bacterium]|nr:YgiQ family radical SAM protein [Clostridia bacterium]
MSFLPVTKQDMIDRGWYYVDFVVVTGDAYVDHPSFGTAIISRVLEDEGFRVAVLAQPEWKNAEDFKRFGRPRYGFMIGSGNLDSMVAHYTAAKKRRSDDAYSPGRKAGKRPDRAVIVYSKLARQAYPDVPIIIGGLEASLRRFAHYDYWDNKIRPSILAESGADILTYGMGENQTRQIARRLKHGEKTGTMTDIPGTCVLVKPSAFDFKAKSGICECPSYEAVCASKRDYAISCRIEQDEQDAVRGKTVIQRHGDMLLVQNPPMPPLTTQELDRVYELPYERYYHPCYEAEGGVPAISEVEFSITHNRGCFGACAFCSLAFHQGRAITCRSEESILKEAKKLVENPHFKGYIHDVGGPTANFRMPSCDNQAKNGLCKSKRCLAPKPCSQLKSNHTEYLAILRKLRALPGVKKVFIRSGIRFDYLMQDKDPTFLKELVQYHISGQLKVAPEHCSAAVLDKMGKPHIEAYIAFARKFYSTTESIGKKQYLVPYLMSSHPGSTLKDAIELALFLKKEGIHPEQVQDFYPTPGTISTCMYYTGLDPYTLEEVYTPIKPEDKALQRALLQYFLPQNKEKVLKALKTAGRYDLIGTGKNCLVNESRQPARRQNGNKSKAVPYRGKKSGHGGRKH